MLLVKYYPNSAQETTIILKLEEYEKDQKLFKLIENGTSIYYLHFTSAELLADEFSNLFVKETANIRNRIKFFFSHDASSIVMNKDIMLCGIDVIVKSLNKSFDLDRVPSITVIFSESMAESVMWSGEYSRCPD